MLQKRLLACMTDLYDAAMDTRAWQGLGARLAPILGGETMGLWMEDHGQVHELVATVPVEALAMYQQYYHTLDPYAAAAAHQAQLTALLGRAGSPTALCPDRGRGRRRPGAGGRPQCRRDCRGARGEPTDRTQIRQILEKTGALHLRDLVRLLTALPAVRPPGPAQ